MADLIRFHVDRFDTTMDIPPRKRSYEAIKARVLEAGRFSVFEATDNPRNAWLFTKLHRDDELVCDHTKEYPWVYVTRKVAVPRD